MLNWTLKMIMMVPFLMSYFWPLWVFIAAHGLSLAAQASLHSGFSCFRAQALVQGGRRCNTGSVVVAHRLSCLTACEIFIPGPGTEPLSPALASRFLTSGPPGKFHDGKFFLLCILPQKNPQNPQNKMLPLFWPQERDDRTQFPVSLFVANLGAVVAPVSDSISCLCPEFVVW